MLTHAAEKRLELILRLENFPALLETLISDLSDGQLNTHFLFGEWTVAQHVHHLADAHMESFIRCKLIYSENIPPLRPYDESK
jgi:hypothetical protein